MMVQEAEMGSVRVPTQPDPLPAMAVNQLDRPAQVPARTGGVPYSAEVADEICRRMSEGESLRQVCRSPDMPSRQAVLKWVESDRSGFRERYERARADMIDAWASEIIEIADDKTGDAAGDTTAVLRARLRIDSRKWLLSKLRPEQYGDRAQVEHSGKGGDFKMIICLGDRDIHFNGGPTIDA